MSSRPRTTLALLKLARGVVVVAAVGRLRRVRGDGRFVVNRRHVVREEVACHLCPGAARSVFEQIIHEINRVPSFTHA